MKKISVILLTAVLFSASVFAFGKPEKKKVEKIVVGATPIPHAEMLELVKEDLAKQGIELEIREFTDYVTPNTALEDGEIDANFFQHIPYMNSFNADHGYHLVNAGGIHIEPLALYSSKYRSLGELPEGALIAIPNDPTNEGRALLLLAESGLISLKDSDNLESGLLDITGNKKKLRFYELEAATIPRVLRDVDAAVINGNYAIDAGLKVTDALLVEGSESPYVNIIAVKEGRENERFVVVLISALKSQRVKDWIKSHYPNGEVIAVD